MTFLRHYSVVSLKIATCSRAMNNPYYPSGESSTATVEMNYRSVWSRDNSRRCLCSETLLQSNFNITNYLG